MSKKQFFEDLVGMANWKEAVSLQSNQAINPMKANGMFGSIPATYHNIKNAKMGWKEGIKTAHEGANGVSPTAIAGSFIAAGAAYRVASGGGVYKDSNGQTNVAGIPFI